MAVTVGIEREGLFAATCPVAVEGRSITVGWRSVGFAHWAYDPDTLARLLPSSVSLDLYGGRAWAGYQFVTVTVGRNRFANAPTLDSRSWRSRLRPAIDEVRAVVAVVDPSGQPGLWYLSVDSNRKPAAAGLRRWFNLQAYEAESRFSASGDRIDYRTRRADGATARLKLTVGPAITPTDVDRFLTARWRIVLPPRFWDPPGRIRTITTVHEPWVLHRASVESFDDDILVAAGLPPAAGAGQALWSPGTSVQVGFPRTDG